MRKDDGEVRSDLRSPRRIAIAVGIFLLLVGVSFVVASTDHDPLGDPPDTFQVVAPRDGDRGSYTITEYERVRGGLNKVNESGDSLHFVQFFHWIPVDGNWELVREVGESRHQACGQDGEFRRFESDLYNIAGEWVGRGGGCEYPEHPDQDDEIKNQRWMIEARGGAPPLYPMNARLCGYQNAFQHGPVDLKDLEGLFGRCGIHWNLHLLDERFTARGMTKFGSEDALLVEGHIDTQSIIDDGQGFVSKMQWTFVPSIAYPVRVSVELPHDNRVVVYDLDWLRPGDTPQPSPPREALDFEHRPWGFLGPAEGDIDHPFPLSEAVQVAREHPLDPRFREFMEVYPDAVVQAADYRRSGHPHPDHIWTVVLSEGKTDTGAFEITQVNSGATPYYLDHHTGGMGPSLPPEYRIRDVDRYDSVEWPHPSDLPDVPTVRSLFDFYESLQGKEADSWGMKACQNWCVGDQQGPFVFVGQSFRENRMLWAEDDVLYGSGSESSYVFDRVTLTAPGSFVEWRTIETHHLDDPAGTTGSPVSAPDDGALSLATDDGGVVWHSDVKVFTWLAVAAFTVAFGYWVWPAFKARSVARLTFGDHDKTRDASDVDAIMGAIKARPGIRAEQLVQTTGIDENTMAERLEELVHDKEVAAKQGPKGTGYFESGHTGRATEHIPLAFGMMALGFFFLVHISVALHAHHLSLTPNFVAYILFAGALARLRSSMPVISWLHPLVVAMAILSGVHFVFALSGVEAFWPGIASNPFMIVITVVATFGNVLVVWHLCGIIQAYGQQKGDPSLTRSAYRRRNVYLLYILYAGFVGLVPQGFPSWAGFPPVIHFAGFLFSLVAIGLLVHLAYQAKALAPEPQPPTKTQLPDPRSA